MHALVSSNGITLKNTTCSKCLGLFRWVHCDPALFVCVSFTVSSSEGTHQGLQWRCQDLPGFSFKPLHLSPVVPLPLTHLILSSFPSVYLLPPLSARRRATVRRTQWLPAWQNLSAPAINYIGCLTPSSVQILAFDHLWRGFIFLGHLSYSISLPF